MSHPTTGLLIPCYNAETYLGNLRKQVDALDPKFEELIVVDDGSTDGTVAKARSLGFDIKPLEVNRGPGAARNAAANLAKAEWIHFLDADDEVAPDYLAKVLPLADEQTDVVLCACDFVDEESRELIMRWSFDDDRFRRNPLTDCLQPGVNTPSSLVRRAKFLEIGGFDEELRCWEDGDMHLRLALAGARFRAIPDVLSFGLRHRRGTSGDDLYCWNCRLRFLRRYVQFLPRLSSEDLCSEVLRAATNLYAEGDRRSSDEALDLAIELGWQGPRSNHPLLAMLAKIPSRHMKKTLFGLQMRARSGTRAAKV